jgi:hypothetical protein
MVFTKLCTDILKVGSINAIALVIVLVNSSKLRQSFHVFDRKMFSKHNDASFWSTITWMLTRIVLLQKAYLII